MQSLYVDFFLFWGLIWDNDDNKRLGNDFVFWVIGITAAAGEAPKG